MSAAGVPLLVVLDQAREAVERAGTRGEVAAAYGPARMAFYDGETDESLVRDPWERAAFDQLRRAVAAWDAPIGARS